MLAMILTCPTCLEAAVALAAVLEAYRWTPRSYPRSLASLAGSVVVVAGSEVAVSLEVVIPFLKVAVASVASLAVSAEHRADSISLDKETGTRTTAVRQLSPSLSGAPATRSTRKKKKKKKKRRMNTDVTEIRPRGGVYTLKRLLRHATGNYSSFAILAWRFLRHLSSSLCRQCCLLFRCLALVTC